MKYKLFTLLIFINLILNCSEVSSKLKITNNTNVTEVLSIYYSNLFFPEETYELRKGDTHTVERCKIYKISIFNFVLGYKDLDSARELIITFFNEHIAINLINDKNQLIKQLIKRLPKFSAPGGALVESKVNATPG